jgi:NhaP-type Na+/H+ and K+/H+ antiporter
MNEQIILFIVMFFVGLLLNPMNILAYRLSDLYLSITLIYSALFMASNMLWSHQIVHYLSMDISIHKYLY